MGWLQKTLVLGLVLAALFAWSHPLRRTESFECKGARFDPFWTADTDWQARIAFGSDEADAPRQNKLAWSPETLPAAFVSPRSF